jgi:hypothetical protein
MQGVRVNKVEIESGGAGHDKAFNKIHKLQVART